MKSALLSIDYRFILTILCIFVASISTYIVIKSLESQNRRKSIRQTVTRYRLSKMLAYIGINIDDYINRLPDYAIYNHIARCKACPDIPTCDRCLHDGMVISNMNFCPNYQSLMKYSHLMPEAD